MIVIVTTLTLHLETGLFKKIQSIQLETMT